MYQEENRQTHEQADINREALHSQARASDVHVGEVAAPGGMMKTIAFGSLKALWYCIKLLGRFTLYMANMIFIVSRQRKIMDSDKSDVVKMKEMDNFRDAVDSTGFVEKDNMMWTEMKKPRKRL